MPSMTPERLAEIEARENATTPGPWVADHPDDGACMGAYAIRLANTPALGDFPLQGPYEDRKNVVAITLLQRPRYAEIHDWRGLQNANFIAHAKSDVPDLIAEVRRLKSALDATTVPSMPNAETIDSLCKAGMTALARRILEGGGFLAIDEAMEWEDLSEQAKGDWRVVVRAAVTEFIGKGGAADA